MGVRFRAGKDASAEPSDHAGRNVPAALQREKQVFSSVIALRYENPIPNCHVKNVFTYSGTTSRLNVRLNTMEVTYTGQRAPCNAAIVPEANYCWPRTRRAKTGRRVAIVRRSSPGINFADQQRS